MSEPDLTNWCYENPKQAAMKIESLEIKVKQAEGALQLIYSACSGASQSGLIVKNGDK